MFCCGLMEDPTPLVDHCCEMFIERRVNLLRTDYIDEEAERRLKAQGKDPLDMSLFDSLYNESSVKLPGHARHYRYINKYNHKYNHHMTPVYTPSRYCEFWNMKEKFYRGPETEIPERIMVIGDRDQSVIKSVLTTCRKISEDQRVTDLKMEEVRCEDLTEVKAPILSRRAASLQLLQCALPVSYLRDIIHQLLECTRTLQKLELSFMDLRQIEEDIDELLERVVSFHESGKAQIKLVLDIGGDEEDGLSNLSQNFADKWRPCIERIKSINCRWMGDDKANHTVSSNKPFFTETKPNTV